MITLKTKTCRTSAGKKKNIYICMSINLKNWICSIDAITGCLLYYMAPQCSLLHMNRAAAPQHLLRALVSTSNYATAEHCVMTEPLPGTHYHHVRYGARYFSRHWTNRYWLCCNNKKEEGERFVLLCLTAPPVMPGYRNLASSHLFSGVATWLQHNVMRNM